jgi:predicted nucleic-acid-binding Zn-ribbon protein
MVDWNEKLQGLKSNASSAQFSSESSSYISISCSNCSYRQLCPYKNQDDSGCSMRKNIYDTLFSKIEFKNSDPIATNRLRLLTHYFVELMLQRSFGAKVDKNEVQTLKTTLSELSKLSLEKSGELINSSSKAATPWESNEQLLKMKKELEEKRQLEMQVIELKKKLKKEPQSDSDVR